MKSTVDFAGLTVIKSCVRLKAPFVKSYICLFICFYTNQYIYTYIELVEDLTTESLTNALRQFNSRREMISDIYSDNATNFVGAYKQLKGICNIFYNNDSQQVILNMLSDIRFKEIVYCP